MRWCQRSAVTAAVAVCASLVLGASAASLPETRSGATTVREGVEPAGADLSAAAAGDGAYDWIDSRQAGGPSFDWIDIPATASSVSFGDDFVDNEVVYVGWPFEFSFPFFGVLQTRVGLTTNGLMLFGSDETSAPARHMPIPTSTAPNGFIAGFWGDLATGPNPRFNCRTSTGAVRYGMEPGGERFVVEFHLGQFCWASSRILLDRGSLTFQVVLDSDGTILIQYADVQGSPRGTIGVEDRYGATGAAVVFDDEYVADGLALRFDPRPVGSGYLMLRADGGIHGFGDASALDANVVNFEDAVKIVSNDDGTGYWVLDASGRVHTYGVPYHGDLVGVSRAGWLSGERPAALSVKPDEAGYWIFTNRGRAAEFGAAADYGDLVDLGLAPILNGPIVDSVGTPDGLGYYMVASDGGMFSFGSAQFHGSMGGARLNAPVNSLVPDPDNVGYWLIAFDGGVFAFDAPFAGSIPGVLPPGVSLNAPVVGGLAHGDGYLMVATDGGIFGFSDLPFLGSLGSDPPPSPVVSVAAFSN